MWLSETLAESGRLPDSLLLLAMRHMFEARLAQSSTDLATGVQEKFIASLGDAPVALSMETANRQHYEIPTAFFENMLGPRMKYSSALFTTPETELPEAEEAMLDLTCTRAQLSDGARVLELGCGWGSLSLWMAEHYPNSQITAICNSTTQKAHIEVQCALRAIQNLDVVLADMNEFVPVGTYDRVVSVEMFEHMRNWPELLRRIRMWLRPGGRLFLHVFCHRKYCYPYISSADSWMARYFFTDGIMPSFDLLDHFQRDLHVEERWEVNGTHYGRTLRCWLEQADARRDILMPIMAAVYGDADAMRWYQRWRMFLLASSAFFQYRGGNEWLVGHYRLAPAEEQ